MRLALPYFLKKLYIWYINRKNDYLNDYTVDEILKKLKIDENPKLRAIILT